ncbi:MAG: ATPase, T2SS/T4P/T4SS family [Planctomycetota bacterium]
MIPSEELLRAAVQMNLVRAERLQELRGQSRRQRVDVVDLITSEGRFPASMLFRAVAEIRGIPFLDLSAEKVDPVLVTKVPQTIVRRRHVLPVREENGEVLVATTSPDDRGSIEAVERAVGRRVRLAIADQRTLERTISYVFGEAASAVTVADGAADTTADATQLMKELLDQAFLSRASDVHMDPQEDGLKLRLRIDGRLRTMWHVSDEAGAALVSRVKVLAGMDIAEQRAPQDGAFTYQPSNVGDEFDIRVATLPATGGEKVTLRLLGHQTDGLTLDSIGLSKDDRASFREAIRTPYGLILLTGPTGSGKSTTLYSALREINDDDLCIIV